MYLRTIAAFVLTFTLLSSYAFSQTTDPAAEKAKKAREIEEQIVAMLDRTIADIGALRLAQNRAVVYALAGDIYWRYDTKRARELFRSGSTELVTYNVEVEREKLEAAINPPGQEFFDPNDPRFEFLNLVGSRDAELALEIMAQTRPLAIAEAMAKIAQQIPSPGGTGGMSAGSGTGIAPPNNYDPDRMRATQEINLEQQLTTRAALTDPDKAAKAIKDSLAKGISMNVISLLQVVLQKDEKRAADLAGDVVAKITGTDLTRTNEDLNGAVSFLQFMARPPQPVNPANRYRLFAFTEAQAKEVAYKLANTFLQASPPAFVTNSLGRALPALEKLVPEKALILKQKDAQNKKTAAANAAKSGQPPARQWDPNGTPEEIIAAAARMPNPRDRTAPYQSAVNKMFQFNDEARAKRIADSIPDEKMRAQALDRLETMRIGRLTSEGKLDEARASIAALTSKRTQIQRLVQLAMQFHRKNNPKDIETAGGLMAEAKLLTREFPEDEDELGDYMELVRGYAAVEPDVAFRMIEPLMDQFNEMVQATAVLSRYNKRDRTFKKGEMVMRINGGGSGILAFRYVQQIQLLAKADLERMNILTDRFQRNDARMLMKLYVMQGYLRMTPTMMGPPPPGLIANL